MPLFYHWLTVIISCNGIGQMGSHVLLPKLLLTITTKYCLKGSGGVLLLLDIFSADSDRTFWYPGFAFRVITLLVNYFEKEHFVTVLLCLLVAGRQILGRWKLHLSWVLNSREQEEVPQPSNGPSQVNR